MTRCWRGASSVVDGAEKHHGYGGVVRLADICIPPAKRHLHQLLARRVSIWQILVDHFDGLRTARMHTHTHTPNNSNAIEHNSSRKREDKLAETMVYG
jgi:hypothetical protein